MHAARIVLCLTALVLVPSLSLARTFAGFDCTDDCSGHIAGYEWAARHNITDPDNCGGNSQSFIEGCEAYAMGMAPEIEDDDEDDPPEF